MLVVVEDGDVERLAQAALDLEAARRGNVLEVDATEDGRDRRHGADDLVDVLRREAHRPGVNAAELLEEDRLAFHDRQGSLGADVAEPEHGRPVADDGDRVLLDRQGPHLRRVLRNRRGHATHTRRVGDREVVSRLERGSRHHLELAAEVREERAVGDVLHLDPVHVAHCGKDAVDLRRVRRQERHVPHLVSAADPHEVDRAEEAPGVTDRLRQGGERARVVLESDGHRRAERGRGVKGGVPVRAQGTSKALEDAVVDEPVGGDLGQCDIVPFGFPTSSSPT
jgi:hypothetical protein